jgi:hypothetical protein
MQSQDSFVRDVVLPFLAIGFGFAAALAPVLGVIVGFSYAMKALGLE